MVKLDVIFVEYSEKLSARQLQYVDRTRILCITGVIEGEQAILRNLENL